jgi:hypothetical protein
MALDQRALEAAIYRYVGQMPTAEIPAERKFYVKVALQPAATDTEDLSGGLFLSMPFLGADRDWLAAAMAYIRDGFNGDEHFHVSVGEDAEYSSFRDEEVGTVLLNLLSSIRITPR